MGMGWRLNIVEGDIEVPETPSAALYIRSTVYCLLGRCRRGSSYSSRYLNKQPPQPISYAELLYKGPLRKVGCEPLIIYGVVARAHFRCHKKS